MKALKLFTGCDRLTDKPQPDLCKCSACEQTFKISECPTDYGHHDGWEMPAYTEISCPKCEDGGCVDDFFFSTDGLNKENKDG